MAIRRVRTKIMLAGFGLISFTMILSTVIISMIFYNQNRDNVFQLLVQSMSVVRDELVSTEEKLINQTRQAANSNDMGLNLDWVTNTSFEDGRSIGMEGTFQTMMKGVFQISLAANIWKTAIYKMDGTLLGFVSIDKNHKITGFRRTNDFLVVDLKQDQAFSDDAWREQDAIEGFDLTYNKPIPEKDQLSFELIEGQFCLVANIAVLSSVIDSSSGSMKEAQVGLIKSVYRLDSDFIRNLEKITGNKIGIVQADGTIIGDLQGYRSFNETFDVVKDREWNLKQQKIFTNTAQIGEETHFQSLLPVFSEENYIGSFVALDSQEKAMANTWQIIAILCLVSLGCMVLFIPISLVFSNSFSKPLEKMAQVLTFVEENGDFSQRITLRSKDEIGRTARAFNNLMEKLQTAFNEINGVLAQVSAGDLSTGIEGQYNGELDSLKINTNKSIEMLAELIGQVSSASHDVYTGAVELTTSSQTLASGTSQQASTLDQISASMDEIEQRTKNNSENALKAQQVTRNSMSVVQNGNTQMERLLVSMNRINETSSQVTKVIKVIDEIAFQTNLLALNAAVEAARAGKYGKGFAVVAEEVRNLAARSADAAKNTTELIQSSLEEVNKGVQNADSTAAVLSEIATGIHQSNEIIEEISRASGEQAESVREINQGLSNVNSVVQQNSSISEESASSSEHLSQQAAHLQELMNGFRLIYQEQETKSKSETPLLPG